MEALRGFHNAAWLAAFTERWKQDPRPWAKQQMFAYVALPFDQQGHQPVVKRLFKHAEATKDDSLMAAFMVAFDCMVRRVRGKKYVYDRRSRQTQVVETLVARWDVLPSQIRDRKNGSSETGKWMKSEIQGPKKGLLYSYVTRYYLRRRAWRYFRYAAFQRAAEYPVIMAKALAGYRSDDLQKGENFLDSWSLMHACFAGNPAVKFNQAKTQLADGFSFADLKAAPSHPHLWRTPVGAESLLHLLATAQAGAIRLWAIQLFREVQPTAQCTITAELLLPLLNAEDDLVQQFGAELISSAQSTATWPLTLWMQLLETKSPAALEVICQQFAKHVTKERLTTEQMVNVALHQASPISRMGLDYLRSLSIGPSDYAVLIKLANAKCTATAAAITTFALDQLQSATYETDAFCRFLDATVAEVRTTAWAWLVSHPKHAAFNDALLFSRLVETPWDDLKLRLVDHLQLRADLPGPDALTPVWTSVLFNVHRGNRQKQKAVKQIADALNANPAQAGTLLPVLAVAVRSVRPTEARAGIAAVVTALSRRPEIIEMVEQFLPELNLAPAS